MVFCGTVDLSKRVKFKNNKAPGYYPGGFCLYEKLKKLCALFILCTLASTGCGGSSKLDKKVCVYAGTGAVLAKDVEVALEKSDLVYEEIDEASIKKGELKDYSVLIVPGGYTKRCVTSLGKRGFERIRDFVESGGGYIGICAGAYMASKTVEVQGHPSGLNIIDVQNKRKAGRRIVSITIIEPEHPLVSGCKKELRIWYQNGPKILAGKDVEKIAVYDKNSAAIVFGKKGKGKVILFSPHPEGNLNRKIDAEKLGTLKLLENAVLFASK